MCTGCNVCRPSGSYVHIGFEQSFGAEQYRVPKPMTSERKARGAGDHALLSSRLSEYRTDPNDLALTSHQEC